MIWFWAPILMWETVDCLMTCAKGSRERETDTEREKERERQNKRGESGQPCLVPWLLHLVRLWECVGVLFLSLRLLLSCSSTLSFFYSALADALSLVWHLNSVSNYLSEVTWEELCGAGWLSCVSTLLSRWLKGLIVWLCCLWCGALGEVETVTAPSE